jgi:arylsulfatase A-like enzyme
MTGTKIIAGALLIVILIAALFFFREPPRYNVVLITLDTTRADRIGCYGYGKRDITPSIDQLAEEGVRFDFAVAQASITPVSHASILTGLNPYSHGVRVMSGDAGYRLPEQVPTLTSMLKENGWTTAAFVSAFPVSERYGFDRGFDRFETGLCSEEEMVRFTGRGRAGINLARGQKRADLTTEAALEWLEDAGEVPFLLWVHYFDPHDSVITPPREFQERFGVYEATNELERLAIYDAEVHFMDHEVGRLLDALRESGEYEDAVVIVVADHGQGLGDHGWWRHRLLYQEQILLPLILRLPDGPEGKVVEELVRSIDILPTVLEALDLPQPEAIEGQSLIGLIHGKREEPRIAYADSLVYLDPSTSRDMQQINRDLLYCVMDRSWKLIYRQLHSEMGELYDMKRDPGEMNNLFNRRVEERQRLMRILEESGVLNHRVKRSKTHDEETLETLRALGY